MEWVVAIKEAIREEEERARQEVSQQVTPCTNYFNFLF